MRLWRISRHVDLSGEGGLLADGRWSRRGRRIAYLAEHPALALLETLVHLEIDAEDVPTGLRVIRVEAPDDLAVTEWRIADLDSAHPDWRKDAGTTRRLGEEFLARGAESLMRVPSVIAPEAYNYLLNPAHPDAARVRIVAHEPLDFDRGLLGRR